MKKFFRKFLYSIKTRILWVFILCVIIPSILCLVLLGNSYLEYIKHSIVEGQKSVLQEMKKILKISWNLIKTNPCISITTSPFGPT